MSILDQILHTDAAVLKEALELMEELKCRAEAAMNDYCDLHDNPTKYELFIDPLEAVIEKADAFIKTNKQD